MKVGSIYVFDKIELINNKKEGFKIINKSNKIGLVFTILILIIMFFIIFYFSIFFKKLRIILGNYDKIKKYSKKEFKLYKKFINYKYKNKFHEIKKKMKIFNNNLLNKIIELKHKESFYLEKINHYNKSLLKQIIQKKIFLKKFLKDINQTYIKKGYVNMNEIESKFFDGRPWIKNNQRNVINIGFQLDPSYILQTMMTLASIIDSQKNTTKLKFHFAVVLGFNVENMFKIYSLREKIREDVEFIFYNAKKVEFDFKGVHPKGPGAIAKILLPHLLANNIERILIFDTGDVLVLRDLTEMYNWNLSDYLYLGTPEPRINSFGKISKKKLDIYINIGHYLVNVKKVKSQKMYKKYLKNKNVYSNNIADQDLLNDIAYGKIGYLPIKYGTFSPFRNDNDSDFNPYRNEYEKRKMNETKLLKNYKKFPFLPRNSDEFFKQSYNPVVIHQWNGKWINGKGLSIYRRLAQYYIRYAGIWEEMCETFPKYCEK